MKDALIADEVQVAIDSDTDIVAVRQSGRDLAAHYGLPSTDLVGVATAISELARNILRYAARGVIILRLVDDYDKRGVEVLAADAGPGIRDVALAMEDGFSTSGSLGLGLPGVRRLMDEFEIRSELKLVHGTIPLWNDPNVTRTVLEVGSELIVCRSPTACRPSCWRRTPRRRRKRPRAGPSALPSSQSPLSARARPSRRWRRGR